MKLLNGEYMPWKPYVRTSIKQSASSNFSNKTVIALSGNPLLKNPVYVSGQFMQDSNASLYPTKVASSNINWL